MSKAAGMQPMQAPEVVKYVHLYISAQTGP